MNNNLDFWEQDFQIASDLKLVKKTIEKEINKIPGRVGDSLKDAFSVEGKLIRPALVLLFAQLGPAVDQESQKKLINIAASVEILHNATLIHDDLIDESKVRRGKPSIQAKYGKKVAVYAGDYLFAICFRLLSDNSKGMDSLQFDGRTMQGILGGELEQLDNTYNYDISIAEYLNQINGKTGLLFGLAAFLGAFESGISSNKAKKASEFGQKLGQAFQIQDDILDYTRTEEDINKPVLLDVKNGIYSAPLIYAMESDATGELKKIVKKGHDLTQSDLNKIKKQVNDSGGVKKAQALGQEQTDLALKMLYKNFNQSEARDKIETLSHRLLTRSY